jgi:hypothetical protein
MTNITAAVTLLGTLTVGLGLGSAITYSLTAQVNVTCPAAAQSSRPQAQTDFFKETQHFPTTGGKSY